MTGSCFADITTTTSNDGLFDGVSDFFDSGTWLVIRNLGIFFVVVFWLASAYWVYKDARRRIDDPWLVAMATHPRRSSRRSSGRSSTSSSGRPSTWRTCASASSRSVRWRSASGAGSRTAPSAAQRSSPSTWSVPVCTTKLKQACASCKAPLEPLWQVCPYCETPIVRQSPVFEETIALSTEQLQEPLRTPRSRRRPGWEEDTRREPCEAISRLAAWRSSALSS